jgi:hypothetical protein
MTAPAPLSRSARVSVNPLGDEADIAYVAFIRAIRELNLPLESGRGSTGPKLPWGTRASVSVFF